MSLQGQKTTTSSMDWDQFKLLISKLERGRENPKRASLYFVCKLCANKKMKQL